MNAVAKTEPMGGEIVSTSGQTLMDVISRAAQDPNTDVDKLERLLGMFERITARQAETAFTTALAELQPKLPVITERGRIVVPAKDGKTGHDTPYATWEDINDAIRPLLSEFGFALSFGIGMAQDGKVTVTGRLSHREGHHEETMITLMHDSSGSKNAVQAVGSSLSYGKRYTAIALLNITSRAPLDRDDNGVAAGAPPTISEEQADELRALMEDVGADKARFLAYLKVESIADIPADKYKAALAALEAKRVKS